MMPSIVYYSVIIIPCMTIRMTLFSLYKIYTILQVVNKKDLKNLDYSVINTVHDCLLTNSFPQIIYNIDRCVREKKEKGKGRKMEEV